MKKELDKIEIVRSDITKLDVDAIVNAASTTLLGGGGVDGAIHRAAGPELLAECRTLGGCQPGEAKLTQGYRLPARFVIHTVGPVWTGGKGCEPQILANCYRNSLQLAVKNRIKAIAFPAISCGAYGYPIPEATRIAVDTTREFLATDNDIDKVIFALWTKDIYEAYRQALGK
jgi:O-acetyl-ADP-ribose deacetylase